MPTNIDSFDLPIKLVKKLPGLSNLLSDRDKTLEGEFTYAQIINEMNNALIEEKSPIKPRSAKISNSHWIHTSVKIYAGTIIDGPVIICRDAEIGPGAYLRPGTLIGPKAKIGFGTEISASIIGRSSKIVHHAYIGNSIIGDNVNIGAGVVIASKRLDGRSVNTSTISGKSLSINLLKLGAWVGNNVNIGAGALVMPGSVISNNVIIWPKAMINGFIPPNATEHGGSTPLFEIVKLLVESFYEENRLFWQRTSVFVTISGALFATFTLFGGIDENSDFQAKIVLSIFGLAVSLAWIQVARMGKHYVNRVEVDIEKILERSPQLASHILAWSKGKRIGRPSGPRATTSIIFVAWISALLWLIILIYNYVIGI